MKAYWYHLSDTIKGKEVVLVPRATGEDNNRPKSEPLDKRICVGPDMAHCLLAICFDYFSNYNVYRTKEEVEAIEAIGVCDSWATKEMWLTEPTEFVRVGMLDMRDVNVWCKLHDIPFPISSAEECDKVAVVEKCFNQLNQIPFDEFINENHLSTV
jgi:hypothetical protein